MSHHVASIVTHRGTLQPEPAENAIKCERCGCRFVPEAEAFGCPGCELLERFEVYCQSLGEEE